MPEIPAYLVAILSSLALAFGTWALAQLGVLLARVREQTKSKTAKILIDTVGGAALNAAATVMNTSIKAIKIAAEDGKLTGAEAAAAAQKAAQLAWAQLTDQARAVLTKEADGSAELAKERFVAPAIERAVMDVKEMYKDDLNKPREAVTEAQLARARTFINLAH